MSTVLVVEDGLTDMEIITSYLKDAGFSVVSAISSEDAHKKLQQTVPDVIVLDVILPDKSGYEICRELQKNPSTSQIPIVFCSTKNTSVDKMWGQELGAKAYLSKPVNKEELAQTLQSLLKK